MVLTPRWSEPQCSSPYVTKFLRMSSLRPESSMGGGKGWLNIHTAEGEGPGRHAVASDTFPTIDDKEYNTARTAPWR